MDSTKNPFAPGAGSEPPELAGRQDIVDKASVCMARIANGLFAKGFLLIGLRGVGKTVMLNQVLRMALAKGISQKWSRPTMTNLSAHWSFPR
jgi:hypothetical protein